MSRTRRFLGAVSLGYVYQGLLMVTGLWLTPFLLRRIGTSDYGLWLVGTQFMFYLGLLDLGVMALLPRSTAYAIGRAGGFERAADLPEIIGQTLRLVMWQMPAVVLAAVVMFWLMPQEWQPLQKPLGIILCGFVLFFPVRIFYAVLQGLQDLSFLGMTQIVTWSTGTLLGVLLVLNGAGLYSLAAAWIFSQALSHLFYGVRFYFRYRATWPKQLASLTWTQARAQLSQGIWISVAQIAQVMLNGTDILIIGKLLGPAAVVPYTCTNKLISVLSNQPNLLMQAAVPGLSEMRAAGSHERLLQTSSALGLAMLTLSGAVISVVLVVNQGFVSWWVGAEQFGGMGLTALFLMALLLRHWNITWIYTLFAFGHERHIAITNLLDGLLTILSALIFVKFLGPIGGPLGTIVGVCLVSLPRNLSTLLRDLEIPLSTLLRPLSHWFWRFAGLVVLFGLAGQIWLTNNFIKLAVAAILAGLIYFAVMLPMAWNSPLAPYLRPRLQMLRLKLFGAVPSNPTA